jgi:hypothetical protein
LLAVRETRQWGYVVGYDLWAIVLLATCFLLVSLLLLIAQRTRRVGQSGLLAVTLLVLTFSIGIAVAKSLGSWDEPMVRFGPDIPASLVVLFRSDASDYQIESFAETVVSVRNPAGGTQLLPGLGMLLKVDMSGHEGYALQFTPSATQQQRAAVRRRVRSDPITWQLFENIAPQKIVLPAN